MITVISPAKTLDFELPGTTRKFSSPEFLQRSGELVEDARAMSPEEIRALMGVSDNIAQLNHRRFMNWSAPFDLNNAKQAIFAFQGDVYTGLEAETLSVKQLNYAQKHLRILSGLYGLLRPLDLMQPYRLEMGLKFSNRGGANLYHFWGDQISEALNAQLKKLKQDVLVNLASNEYFKAVRPKNLNAEVITPIFKDLKSGKYKVISFYAKKARGEMARYIIENEIEAPEGLKKFNNNGYKYSKAESTARELVFTRDTPPNSK
ncbi:MAG: cytoplasmic iron level regulating protein YaaA (DUF328/UPF0246 family) [Halioglobus sp.]|jgi:cytoplasmic iron level regulating protein YaaA (DUF328/UPF0246 family)